MSMPSSRHPYARVDFDFFIFLGLALGSAAVGAPPALIWDESCRFRSCSCRHAMKDSSRSSWSCAARIL